MDEPNKISPYRVITVAGSIIALLIGSGFATGQEILQYFASYGWMGFLGILLTGLLMAFVSVQFIRVGYKEQFSNSGDVFKYYAGQTVGTFFDYFSILFIFMSYIVMLAGSGATVVEQYQLPNWVGVLGMLIVSVGVVLLGLDRIVDVIGNIGPVIIALSIFVGIVSIITNFDNIATADGQMAAHVADGTVIQASNNTVTAAFSYVGFCLFWLAGFLSQIGSKSKNLQETVLGGYVGSLAFAIALMVMSAGILLAIDDLAGSQIPALILARNIHPTFGWFYSLTILLGIFTTSVPLLWTVLEKFTEEGTKSYRILAVVLGVVASIIALFVQFDQIVNVVYVLNGYVGFIMILLMIWKTFRPNSNKKEKKRIKEEK